MAKKLEERSDHELLMELVREKRRADVARSIRIAVWAVVIALLVYFGIRYIPPIVETLRRWNETMRQLQTAVDDIQKTVGGWKDSGVEQLQNGLERLNESLDKIRAFLRLD